MSRPESYPSRLRPVLKKIMISSLVINLVGVFGSGYWVYKNRSSVKNWYSRNIKGTSHNENNSLGSITRSQEEDKMFSASNENLINKPLIIFVGDSLTNGFAWNEWLAGETDAVVVNRASSGEKLDRLIERFGSIFYHKNDIKKVFIMIGINDIRTKGFQIDVFIEGYQVLLKKLLSITSPNKVYITSILPTRKQNKIAVIQSVNESLKTLARIQNVYYLDLYDEFIDVTGLLDRQLTYDGIHLTVEGYKIWLAAIKECISPSPHNERILAALSELATTARPKGGCQIDDWKGSPANHP